MSKKLLISLFIILILASLILAGCSNAKSSVNSLLIWSGLKRRGKIQEVRKKSPPQYVGAGRCVSCHAANYYVWKLTTRHPNALQTLVERKEEKNKECLPCHTVGYDLKKNDKGYDDKDVEKHLLEGIQCENCHGRGNNHIRGLGRLKKSYSAEVCKCHTGPHHPTVDEWKSSKHARSLQMLKESGKAENRCLKCMSTEAILEGNIVLEKTENSITCVACHNPHLNIHNYGLRMAEEELCVSCHTKDETGSHPQKEMVLGKDILYGIEVTVHDHDTAIGTKCLTCHYYNRQYKSDAEPAITGHDFKARIELCHNCHKDAQARWESTQAEVKGALASLKTRMDSIDSSKIPQDKKLLYDEIQLVYKALTSDGSFGIHNKAYAKALLKAAEDRLVAITGKK